MSEKKYDWIHQPVPHIRIPKALFYSPDYNWMHMEAIVLYGYLLDRMMLSINRGGERYRDKLGDVYVIFPMTEVMDRLHCGHDLAGLAMKELVKTGLIRVKKLGCGKPNRIYVLPPQTTITRESRIELSDYPKSGDRNLQETQSGKTADNKPDQNISESNQTLTATRGSVEKGVDRVNLVQNYPRELVDNVFDVFDLIFCIDKEKDLCVRNKWYRAYDIQQWVLGAEYADVCFILEGLQKGSKDFSDYVILEYIVQAMEEKEGMNSGKMVHTPPKSQEDSV